MRSKFTYLLIIFAMAFISCEKIGSDSEEIDLSQKAGYIKFSSSVSTKAPIITSLRGDAFGVIGFEYPNYQSWSSARSLATPNLCHELAVECDEYGSCSYDTDPNNSGKQYMLWDLLNNHTFFAYYPLRTNNNGITISGSNNLNTPYIIYDIPLGNGENAVDPDNLLDIMTGYAVDQTVRSGEVGFKFQHRLTCIDVIARNFNDNTQQISNLSIELNGIQYNRIKIPMQKGDSQFDVERSIKTGTTIPATVRFNISSDEIVEISKNQVIGLTGNENEEKNIIIIPQDNHISGTAHFKNNGETKSMTFNSEFELEEGKKYSIIINFTGDDIIVLMVESGAWEVVPVKHDFD